MNGRNRFLRFSKNTIPTRSNYKLFIEKYHNIAHLSLATKNLGKRAGNHVINVGLEKI